MKLFILILPFVYAIKNSCRSCVWIRNKIPDKLQCGYYQIPITNVYMNCSTYKLKNIDW